MRFQTGYYFRKGIVVQQDFEKGRSQRLWSRRYDRYKNKLAIFFRVSRWGRRGGGGGGGACTRYFTVFIITPSTTAVNASRTIRYCNMAARKQ